MTAGSSRLETKEATRGVGGGAAGAPRSKPPPSSPSSSSSSSPPPSSPNDGGGGVRVRQVELRLHLEDVTADVVERRLPNSGLEQGLIARRHHLPRRALLSRRSGEKGERKRNDGDDPFAPKAKTDDDAPLGPEDIRVGDVIDVFGRGITIADADAATRAWLLSKSSSSSPSSDSSSSVAAPSSSPFDGLPGEAIPVPEGDYEVAMRASASGKKGSFVFLGGG